MLRLNVGLSAEIVDNAVVGHVGVSVVEQDNAVAAVVGVAAEIVNDVAGDEVARRGRSEIVVERHAALRQILNDVVLDRQIVDGYESAGRIDVGNAAPSVDGYAAGPRDNAVAEGGVVAVNDEAVDGDAAPQHT